MSVGAIRFQLGFVERHIEQIQERRLQSGQRTSSAAPDKIRSSIPIEIKTHPYRKNRGFTYEAKTKGFPLGATKSASLGSDIKYKKIMKTPKMHKTNAVTLRGENSMKPCSTYQNAYQPASSPLSKTTSAIWTRRFTQFRAQTRWLVSFSMI